MTARDYVQALIRADVRAGTAYQVADATGMVKLDAMENPYEWPAPLRAELAKVLADVAMNRYPDPHAEDTKAAVRAWMGVPESLACLFGNGSDEIIALIISNFIGSGLTVCAPDPSFVMFRVLADQYRVPFVSLPLDAQCQIDRAQWLSRLAETTPGVIFIPQPNNPTGNLFREDDLRAVIESTSALVVIDEAYTAFSDREHLAWATEYPNVVVMRTLSKVGLAGLRLGLLIGDPVWVHEFDKLRLPYNINVMTQAAVRVAMTHHALLESQSAAIRDERSGLIARLRERGLTVWESQANFVVAFVPEGNARAVFDHLKLSGVLVKCLDGSHPLLQGALRITVGTPAETDALLAALDQSPVLGR
ncbi:MAG: histidinol-phosphate transaminase [Gammaproteobacteria bacterium]|nr:histidinol-phosphate transaminase [Gammaproteobacteria bacterium]